MIPEQLHLRNFLSHRETDLDLRGVHVASLVGDNGAGKSALLDAITWVVWGQSRAPHGREDDLIFHGENGLEVEYVFVMPYQGGMEHRYRILRRREKRGRRLMSTQLDFQVEGEDGWRILTADSVRETQKRIITHLGLDYDTFINSAYLRQGHADEFTVQTPAQRKRVLSAVLGLDRWVVFQERAKSVLSEYQVELKAANARLGEIETELAQKAEYEQILTDAQAEMETAEHQLLEIQSEIDTLIRAQEKSGALQRQIADVNSRLQQEMSRLQRLEKDLEQLRERNEHIKVLFAQADTIEKDYREFQELIKVERNLGEKLSRTARLQQQKAELERSLARAREAINQKLRDIELSVGDQERIIQEARASLDRELGELQSQVKLLEERLPGHDAVETLEQAKQRLAEFDNQTQQLENLRQKLRNNEVDYSRIYELNRQYRAQMDEAKAKMDALGKAEAACPLCGQPLTREHREELLDKISVEGQQMGDTFRSNQLSLKKLTGEQKELRENINNLEIDLRLRPAQEQHVARLQQQIEQGEQAKVRVLQLREKAQNLDHILRKGEYAEKARGSMKLLNVELHFVQVQIDKQQYAAETHQEIERIDAEVIEVGYDAAYHDEVKTQIESNRHLEHLFHELENARTTTRRDEEMQSRLMEDIVVQQHRMQTLEIERETCQQDLDEIQPILSREPVLTQRLSEARNLAVVKRQQLGAAKQNLAVLDTLEQRAETYREKRLESTRYVGLYTELRDACGVNGIPAMIIEHTLPELEREANRILQQLTGGRMHVRFDTQRETKSGSLRETLDIIISDEKGTRPYENFSGGEQFRVNFAIRVALSRLLARRSGVRLRSLFVDEGFGALDADGRQRLVEAVKTVQDSFHLIMVITHINELREAFPTQILVAKSDAGSVVEVV